MAFTPAYVTLAVTGVGDAGTVIICVAGVPPYVVVPCVTKDAVRVYAPGRRFEKVCGDVVTFSLKDGPVTVTVVVPGVTSPGSPLTMTCRLPVAGGAVGLAGPDVEQPASTAIAAARRMAAFGNPRRARIEAPEGGAPARCMSRLRLARDVPQQATAPRV